MNKQESESRSPWSISLVLLVRFGVDNTHVVFGNIRDRLFFQSFQYLSPFVNLMFSHTVRTFSEVLRGLRVAAPIEIPKRSN